MPKAKTAKKKAALTAAPYDKAKAAAAKKVEEKPKGNPNFVSRPRNFGIGNDIQPKRDVSRFVRWPRYIKLQRQKRVLYHRLKVPPAINLFTKTLEKNNAAVLFKLLLKYRPEDRTAKKKRLREAAKVLVEEAKAYREAKKKAREEKKELPKAPAAPKEKSKKPITVKYGINHITTLIEQKKAKLVVIAHDVDPIELVVWLPALCRRNGIPYCIVKGKARLGQIVHKKTATALVFTQIRPEDSNEFANLVQSCTEKYLDQYDQHRKQYGGGKPGLKSLAVQRKRARAIAKEERAKLNA